MANREKRSGAFYSLFATRLFAVFEVPLAIRHPPSTTPGQTGCAPACECRIMKRVRVFGRRRHESHHCGWRNRRAHHRADATCAGDSLRELYEQGETIREPGVGINTLPHAIKELAELGLLDTLDAAGIRTYELIYTNRFGQEIWREPRGTDAGYEFPQFSIHRGRLQGVIHNAVRSRIGNRAFMPAIGLARSLKTKAASPHISSTGTAPIARAHAAMFSSAPTAFIRRPRSALSNEGPTRWNGSMLWRGAIDWPQFLTGRSMVIAGGMAAKLVIYPIGEGSRSNRPLTNWAVLVKIGEGGVPPRKEDWSRLGRCEELMPHVQRFRIPYVDAKQ